MNIKLGNYYLKVAYGKEFRKLTQGDQCIVKFLRDAVYKKGEETFEFDKIKKPDVVRGNTVYERYSYSYYELSLNIELKNIFEKGGGLRTKKISEKEFNQ